MAIPSNTPPKPNRSNVIKFNHLVVDDNTDPRDVIRHLDPEDFHTPVSDSHGHSDRIQFRGLKQMKAMVMEIIQTKQFPYRSDSDLYRHALVRHLRWLTDQGYVGRNTIFTINAIMEIARDDEIHQEFLLSIEKLHERVSYHRINGDEQSATIMVKRVGEQVKQLPDTNRWKTRYKTELERRFPSVIDWQTE